MSLHPLRLYRLEKGWSQHHLSFASKVPQVKISYAERGYPALSDKQKKQIAEALCVNIETLFPDKLQRNFEIREE